MAKTSDRRQTGAVHTYQPAPEETPAQAVITAVAEEKGLSPLDMESLVGTVDPEALNEMLSGEGATDAGVAVGFDYAGFRVTAAPDEVRLAERE